jgi:DNA polymerase-3 subunit gamma/tau
MDNFIVSARKYRPQTFADVVGQKHITDTLINEIKSKHLAQAFLFTGPRGVGKTTCARILSRVINTDENTKPEQDFAFNIFELDAASNNSVDDIRSLNEQVRVPPQTGKFKVYIIDEVHMLSASAFNAFLKTLEEPPSYAIFILATTEKHKILPTILSRCQIFNFNRIKIADIVDYLANIAKKEKVEVDSEALHIIAQKADGGMRDALSMFDQLVSFCNGKITYEKTIENLNLLDADYYFQIADALFSQDAGKALNLFDEILQKGFDGHQFMLGLNDHYRNLLMVKDSETHKLLEVSENLQDKYKEQAEKTAYGLLLNGLNVAHRFEYEYKTASNKRLHIELCLMKLNALPYLMKGETTTKGNEGEAEDAVVMEFKTAIAIPVSPKKQKRVLPATQKSVAKASIKGKLKLAHPKDAVQLISKEQLEKIPKLNAKSIENYKVTNQPKLEENIASEPQQPTQPEKTTETNSLAFTLENVRASLDELANTLISEQNKKSTGNNIKLKEFAIHGNNLLYTFNSTFEEKQFSDCKAEINGTLKRTFGMDKGIEMMVSISESEAKQIFSPTHKLVAVMAKSDAVKKLVDALGLGIKK